MPPKTFSEAITLEDLGNGEYASKFFPERMGNTAPIAYGGCTLSIAIAAAAKTVGGQYHLYSAQGNYLGPASTDRVLFARARAVRDTKSFATRQIEISQEQDDGKRRICLIMTADFHVKETKSVLEYSAPPEIKFTPPEHCRYMYDNFEKAVKDGIITQKMLDNQRTVFALMARYFEQKIDPEGFSEQILGGMAKDRPTTQDHLTLTERVSADWFKNRVPLSTPTEHVAALSFELDGKVSFLPGLHERFFITEVGACSSLDFSLRIFTADVDLNDWHLRQFKTFTGGEARTFSEAKLWNREGKMIASMTQQCILRPKPDSKKKSNL